MNIRYAKPIDKDQVVSVWNYCFEDGEDFVKYYFENVYDENNTIIIEENDEVLSALQLNKYTICLLYTSSVSVGKVLMINGFRRVYSLNGGLDYYNYPLY